MTQEQKQKLAERIAEKAMSAKNVTYAVVLQAVHEALDSCDEEVNELQGKVEAMESYIEAEKACMQDEVDEMQEQLKRLRAELAKAQNPWRDAQTDPPKEGQEVFAHVPNLCGGEYCKLTYLGNYRWSQDEGEWTIEFTDSTVHWMPIPKSVKGGNV